MVTLHGLNGGQKQSEPWLQLEDPDVFLESGEPFSSNELVGSDGHLGPQGLRQDQEVVHLSAVKADELIGLADCGSHPARGQKQSEPWLQLEE